MMKDKNSNEINANIIYKGKYDEVASARHLHYDIYYSKLDLGGTLVMLKKKYNWFHRLMIRLVFGLKIERIK